MPTTQTSSEKEHEDFSIYQDKTESKDVDGNLTTVGEIAEDQNKHNALGVAGMFHIFQRKLILVQILMVMLPLRLIILAMSLELGEKVTI
ncbi:hypothetical protein [Lactobacillus helveticus]|uniref:hypothetical protein n=1 Tax=Lactobacillus helveticus TaxID=1587 RepID=UPI000B0AB123|nr:hypothetical protein [Lactobacillus helveticus]